MVLRLVGLLVGLLLQSQLRKVKHVILIVGAWPITYIE